MSRRLTFGSALIKTSGVRSCSLIRLADNKDPLASPRYLYPVARLKAGPTSISMRFPREPAYRTVTRLSAATLFEPPRAKLVARRIRGSDLRTQKASSTENGNRREEASRGSRHFIKMLHIAFESRNPHVNPIQDTNIVPILFWLNRLEKKRRL